MKNTLLLICIPFFLYAQYDQADRLEQFFKGQHEYFQFNGNVLIAREGKPIFHQSLGYADFDTKRVLNENTAFELASISKQFTAMAILICRDRGLLDLEDDVKTFLPSLPYAGITIRHLLTHTSGLPAYEEQFEKYWDRSKIAFNKDIVPMLSTSNDTLFFKPGTQWKYSNTGYALLAVIIEQVSNLNYHDFLDKNIFRPLGMNRTFVFNSRRSTGLIPDNYALGYVYSDSLKRYILPDSTITHEEVRYLDGIVGDGCVNSTTGDLLIWDRALYINNLVSQRSLHEMLSPQVLISPRDSTTYYGYGLRIQPNTSIGKVTAHTGSWPGYTALMERRTDVDETIIVLSNNETSNGNIQAAILSILGEEPLILPYQHKAISLAPEMLDRYAGKYFAFLTMEFISKEGKLYRTRKGTADIELIPESETKFFYGDGTDRQIEFELDTAGKVIKAWFVNTGQRGELKKIE